MDTITASNVLIVEPNKTLTHPYIYLPYSFQCERVSSIIQAKQLLSYQRYSLTFLSASLALVDTLEILEIIKKKITVDIPPIIFIVDLTYPISSIPGTTWAGKIAVLDRYVAPQEFLSSLSRLLL